MILVALSGGPRSAALLSQLLAEGKRCKTVHIRQPGRDADAVAAKVVVDRAGVEHAEILLDLGCAIPAALAAALVLPHALCECRDCLVHAVCVGRLDEQARDVFLALMDRKFLFLAPLVEQWVERAA